METFRFEDEHDYEIWLTVFFNLFSRIVKKNQTPRNVSLYVSSPEKLALFPLEDVKPPPNHKMIKLLTINNLFSSLRHPR